MLQRGATEIVDVLSVGPVVLGSTDLVYRLYPAEAQWFAEPLPLDGDYVMTLRVCAGSAPAKEYRFSVAAKDGRLTVEQK
jgi:hypothetical protein